MSIGMGLGMAGFEANRIVSLTLRLSGVNEQNQQIKDLTSSIRESITALRILQLSVRLFEASNPLGWVLLGASFLSEATMVKSEFTSTEEVDSRGTPR
jgi:hypothetical protein